MQNPNVSQNSGVVQSGGTINAGALAIGENASAENHANTSEAIDELLAKLDRVIDEIRQHENAVGTLPAEALQHVKEEVRKPAPDKNRILSTLDGVATAVKSIASLGTAILAIRGMVTGLF